MSSQFPVPSSQLKEWLRARTPALQFFFALLIFVFAGVVHAEEPPDNSWQLSDHLSWDLRILTYGVFMQPAESTQNPGNMFMRLPHRIGSLDARPDLRLNLPRLEFSAKPRMRLSYQDRYEDDWHLNEWLARFKVRENLFVSYGRENLQWGPSFLFSPSNPFFVDNGRRNTFMEVPGMDFARLVWLPGGNWTVSLIANTGEGSYKNIGSGADELEIRLYRFEKTYAVKTDYVGRSNYFSFILSRKDKAETALGFYGGWTAADAVLLYAEGSISQRSRALRPMKNQSPFGFSLEMTRIHDTALRPVILAGGSYTFPSKGILTLEYAHHSPGYSASEAGHYYEFRENAAAAFNPEDPWFMYAQQNLGVVALNGLRFLRRNYAMAQYSHPDIANRFDLTLRWTQGIDDGSGMFTSILSCSVGKHLELFSVETFTAGGKNKEFTSIVSNQWQLGLQYTF
jgi:hypothetical protein